jgi:acetylornithine deacetylase/succinyl-diaminopimelate desuccinylase-like protein
MLRESIDDFARQWPETQVRVRRVLLAAPLVPIEGQQRLIDALQRAARQRFASELPLAGVPIYTDARHYAAAGVPTVLYGAGPRTLAEANGHRADEQLRLDDLHRATDVVALAIADLLAPHTRDAR